MRPVAVNRWQVGIGTVLLVLIVLPPLAALLVPGLLPPAAPGAPPVRVVEWRVLVLLARTVGVACLTATLATLSGLALGYALAAQHRRRQPWLAGLIGIPLTIPPFINALSAITLPEWLGLACPGFAPAIRGFIT